MNWIRVSFPVGPRIMGRRVRLIFPVLCTALGTWQLYRLQWKKTLLADIESGLRQPPIAVDQIDPGEIGHRPFTLRPSYSVDTEQEPVCVGPRTARGILPDHDFGFMVIRRLRDGHGQSYLLNDGWIPWKSKAEDAKPSSPQASVYLLDRSERPSSFTKQNDPSKGEWYWKDTQQLADHLHTSPVLIKRITHAAGTATPASATFEIPNRHLEYVLTWYGLAATTFLMSFLKR